MRRGAADGSGSAGGDGDGDGDGREVWTGQVVDSKSFGQKTEERDQ